MNPYFILIIYCVIINFISYLTMYHDKNLSKAGNYRVSEKTLFILALLLGGIGIYAGIYRFRHKTKHMKFTVGIPVCIILNIISIYCIIAYVFPKINL